MSGRLTAGAATAVAPTWSRTRGRVRPLPGRGDCSPDGGVHSDNAGVKEEDGVWWMTSPGKDEWMTSSSDTGSLGAFDGMGMGGVVERERDDMMAATRNERRAGRAFR